MRIEFDYDVDAHGNVMATHYLETDPAKETPVQHPGLGAVPVSRVTAIHAIHTGVLPMAGSGWDVITKHPVYPGQTRMAVFLSEIVRLNDVPTRTLFGL